MAQFLRGKQAGITTDFSASIQPDLFVLDDLARFGISSQISQLAYDPVQSLLAVGTNSTKFGPGQVYVFGHGRISATFPLQRQGASVKELQFCSDRLVVLDTKNDVGVLSLLEKRWTGSYSPPGSVTAIATDPTLDYVMMGMQNGEVMVYDMDRDTPAPFRIQNLWQEHNPRNRSGPVVALSFHPRDIGKILVGYADGAVIFSFKKDEPRKFFQYHVPAGAPGGDADPNSFHMPRYPKLTQAIWHPTGTFVLTGHEDSSLVIWDPKDGRIIKARTLTDTNVDQPGSAPQRGKFAPKSPILKVAWCANQDPDDTGILVAGGTSSMGPTKGLTFLELGRTPTYATSSWQLLSDHFETPRRQRMLPTPPGAEVMNFCLVPRKSPWFSGTQDPIALIAILSSGEITTLSFPSGYPISPTNQLHLSLTVVHPFVTAIANSQMERGKWLGMMETRQSGPPILQGGTEAPHPLKRFEGRSIISTAHGDGTVRLWDMGHADQIENETLLQADVARAVGRMENVQISAMALSGASNELATGLRSGEIVIFRWGKNPRPGREPGPAEGNNKAGVLTNVTDRRDPSLTEGFHPYTLLDQGNGPCTALKVSDVGFIGAGFEGGQLVLIDMRGPAIIFSTNVRDLTAKEKSGPFRRKSSAVEKDWPTALEFSVMTVEGDDYSSILLHAGTKNGTLVTLKITPAQGGRYTASVAGSTALEGTVHLIHPLSISSGNPAFATPSVVGNLRNGVKVDGTLLVVTKAEARIFRPAAARGAHRSWDGVFCDRAAVTRCHDAGTALVCLFGDGTARSYSLPGLREIGSLKLDKVLDVRRFPDAIITDVGEIVGWTGPSELAMLGVWGTGDANFRSEDKIFNPTLMIPPRPTISNFQWVSGTQYITPSDMDVLISGPGRPPSKRMLEQARSDEAARRQASQAGRSSDSAAQLEAQRNYGVGANGDEGYWAYMQRQVQERTEKLGLVGDRMDSLEDNSQGWTEDVNKFVSQQKKNMIMGVVKNRLGF